MNGDGCGIRSRLAYQASATSRISCFRSPIASSIGAVSTAQTTEPARSVRPTGTKIDTFYRQVLQDILDSLGRKSTVERHLLGNAAGGHRTSLQATLVKMGRTVTESVFGHGTRCLAGRLKATQQRP